MPQFAGGAAFSHRFPRFMFRPPAKIEGSIVAEGSPSFFARRDEGSMKNVLH